MIFAHAVVTGGAGFVGSHLALRLQAAGLAERVTALDNLKRRGSELQLARLRSAGVAFLHGDIRAPADLEAAGAFDLLIDCAAEPSVHAGMTGSPLPVLEHNLVGTINCMESCRRHNAAFLLLSSSRVYPIGALNAIPVREHETRFEWEPGSLPAGVTPAGVSETMALDGGRSFYGASKLCSELLAREYAEAYGLRVLINRCGVIAGPWQMGKVDQGVVALWVAAHYFGRPLQFRGWGGTGKQVRDLLHIEDLCDLLELQLRDPAAWDGSAYNVGGGLPVSTSLLELTAIARRTTGRIVEVGSSPATAAVDLRIYLTDTTRARARFGWQPTRDAGTIADDLHEWIRTYASELRPIFS